MKVRPFMFGAALSVIAATASAHAHLRASNPADGSTISVRPSSIELEFSEAARVTAAWVQRGDEPKRRLGPLSARASAKVTIPSPDLAPGHYAVSWRVIGQDGHVTSGQIHFTIATASGK